MTLVPVDPTNALAVSDYLAKARDWLATAVERTGPTDIAAAKAEIATAAEATKQLGLSKEIQQDATEMVRRADYALGKAIRRGQETGTVVDREDNLKVGQSPNPSVGNSGDRLSPTSLIPSNRARQDTYVMADLDREDFDAAIDEAKAEGNLSRAHLALPASVLATALTT